VDKKRRCVRTGKKMRQGRREAVCVERRKEEGMCERRRKILMSIGFQGNFLPR
jgi:hypothetical protein